MFRFRFLVWFFLLSAVGPVLGGEEQISSSDLGFTKGTREFETLVGGFTSLNDATRKRPKFNFALASVRLGWMLDDLRSGLFFGNEEFLIEAFGGPIIDGPGSAMGGLTLMLRHNFVLRQDAFFVPYFQIGAGGVASDASEEHPQFAIGAPVEFNLQSALGARWRVNRAWSVTTEFNYRHISNAGLSARNGGVDSVGGFIGLGHLF